MKVVIDNDILFKGSCYGILNDLVATLCSTTEAGVLGSAKFVIAPRFAVSKLRHDSSGALARFSEFLSRAVAIEPTVGEQRMAADLELTAQRLGVNLDSGESQLCAVVVSRVLPFLLTGDKRAITAMERLIDADNRLTSICGKVKCLEQLVCDALLRGDHLAFRIAICSEADVDKALAICFSCTRDSIESESVIEGLKSYIGSLRMNASRVLST
jgi:hypothetical protein